jgi:hypothetical protein
VGATLLARDVPPPVNYIDRTNIRRATGNLKNGCKQHETLSFTVFLTSRFRLLAIIYRVSLSTRVTKRGETDPRQEGVTYVHLIQRRTIIT